MLSNDGTREAAVSTIQATGTAMVPLLLSWTRTPPPQVDREGLYAGLAYAFGRLRTQKAIPFLVKHISMQEGFPSVNIWMKSPAVIEGRLPAVKALIQIGPEASKTLINSPWDCMSSEDRLAALFVVSQIPGVPEARGFIGRAVGEANLQHYWAEEGLRVLDARNPPPK